MNFRSNALAMLLGTVMAQAIPLLVSPLLTRLYSPEAFGIQTLFMGMAAAAAVLATCRLDLAVVLPESEVEAREIAGFVLVMTALVCAAGVALAVAAPWLRQATGYAHEVGWLWLLPVMVAGIVAVQLAGAFASRAKDFRPVAKANVLNQATYACVAVAAGAAGAWTQGLAWAKLAGQLAAGAALGGGRSRLLGGIVPHVHLRQLRPILQRYRQFFIFNTPYSLVGSVARDAPIFIFSAFSALPAAGFYGLARTVLLAPTLLASNALSQVFFREAVALKGSPRLEALTRGMLRAGLIAAAPLFAFVAVWGDAFFGFIFGERWLMAGSFAMLLAPAAWMSVQTGWPERLFEVNARQGVSFAVQLGSDLVTAGAFAAALFVTRNPLTAIGVFAACNVLYHHIYLVAIFRISGFSLKVLAKALVAGWVIFGACALVLAGLRHFSAGIAVMSCSALLAVAIALAAGMYVRKSLAPDTYSGDSN